MKKISIIVALVFLIASFCACSADVNDDTTTENTTVSETTSVATSVSAIDEQNLVDEKESLSKRESSSKNINDISEIESKNNEINDVILENTTENGTTSNSEKTTAERPAEIDNVHIDIGDLVWTEKR